MKALHQGVRKLKIFKRLLAWAIISLMPFCVLEASQNQEIPAEVFSSLKLTLKNREVIREKSFLFTRVDMKPMPGVSGSMLESQASLFALRNFAGHISGTVVWDQLKTEPERTIALALFQRADPNHVTVMGLTPIKKTANSNTVTFIYAAHAPPDDLTRIHERDIVGSIRNTLRQYPDRIDFLSYLELALRNPKLFDAKPAVKGLATSFGDNFPLFLLGLDVPNPESLIGQEVMTLAAMSAAGRNEIALLLGRMPYHPVLSIWLTESLLADSHEEVAKLAIAGSCRLSKTGPAYERAVNISRQLKTDLSGSYIHPVSAMLPKRVADELVQADIPLSPCLEAALLSLGDLPMKAEKRRSAAPVGDSITKSASSRLSHGLDRLQLNANSCRIPEDLVAVGDLFMENGFPNIAFCFFNQAASLDPENGELRDKVRSAAGSLGIAQYSKNARRP